MAKPFKSQFDLMAEAYGKVNYSKQRIISEHSSARKVRGYEPKLLTEAHCDEETSESVELGGDLYEVGAPDPSNESELIISIVKHDNGYMITTGQFSSPEDFVTKGPDSAIEAGGYALSLEGQPMDEDDLEDRSSREEDRDADPFRHEGMTDTESEDADADPFRHDAEDGEHVPAEDSSCASHSDEEHSEDAEGSPIQACTAAIDELAATLQGDDKLAAFEDLRDYLNARLGQEDAEGHHSSGSDDGECDECGGDGCDVCHGTGEQDEEEVVAESYT